MKKYKIILAMLLLTGTACSKPHLGKDGEIHIPIPDMTEPSQNDSNEKLDESSSVKYQAIQKLIKSGAWLNV